MDELWSPGDQVTLRYVGHSDGMVPQKPGLLVGYPYVVAEDRPDLLALWIPIGTAVSRVDLSDRSRAIPDEAWRLSVLRVMQPGKPYSIWQFWSAPPEHRFLGWYVNLEAPFARTPIGVDTTDDVLDVVVSPDLTWRWKDEHALQQWIDVGVYTAEEFERIYEHGLQAIADVEARRFPFDHSMTDWRPEEHWGVPQIHPDWDRIPGYDFPLSTGRRLIGVDHPPDLTPAAELPDIEGVSAEDYGVVPDDGPSAAER
jgi:hypothetical protein